MNRVEKFVELQLNANAEIDNNGEVSDQTADELNELGAQLTEDEVEEAVKLYEHITTGGKELIV